MRLSLFTAHACVSRPNHLAAGSPSSALSPIPVPRTTGHSMDVLPRPWGQEAKTQRATYLVPTRPTAQQAP